ncbi:MAG: BspA family leucine-rich repeat surface protein [Chitinophagaceae bacterium]
MPHKIKTIYALTIGLIIAIAQPNTIQAQVGAFITEWVSNDDTLKIPITGTGYSISWTNVTNPGSMEGSQSGLTQPYTITNIEPYSTYRVSITGNYSSFRMITLGDPTSQTHHQRKLRGIVQWGTQVWENLQGAFYWCDSLSNYYATDTPNLTAVTDLSSMFLNCRSFNGDISNWNTEHVTKMDSMFAGATIFNQPIGNWNTANVTNMTYMFWYATNFNQAISGWNTANVNNMKYMFAGARIFNQPIGNWNTANVTDMSYMF